MRTINNNILITPDPEDADDSDYAGENSTSTPSEWSASGSAFKDDCIDIDALDGSSSEDDEQQAPFSGCVGLCGKLICPGDCTPMQKSKKERFASQPMFQQKKGNSELNNLDFRQLLMSKGVRGNF